jgi:hypothetical protein
MLQNSHAINSVITDNFTVYSALRAITKQDNHIGLTQVSF